MKDLLNKIHEYLKSLGVNDDELYEWDSSSVYFSQAIALYAHQKQFRVNGDTYFTHPYNCLNIYRRLVGIVENDYFCLDENLMAEIGIPFKGVQEVCLLHDVVEDCEITIDDLREVFNKVDLGRFFEFYIEPALKLITHDKSEDYPAYIEKCLEHPVASLVKMIDMTDNMNLLSLDKLTDEELTRTIGYAKYIKQLNDKWHFIEKANEYNQIMLARKSR